MPRITPIRMPERASGHLARVHCSGSEEVPATAWFAGGVVNRDPNWPVGGTQREAFVGVRQRTRSLSAPASTLRMAGL